jgi:murein DD-endopeptidase MepM/ murein hydrolase activator NlpD
MNRVLLPLVLFMSLVSFRAAWSSPPDFRLQVVPAIVYKVDDPGGSRTSSFVFDLAVICSTDCDLSPVSAHVELSNSGSAVERQDWTAETLTKIKQTSFRIEANTPPASPAREFTLPEAFDLRFYFREARALDIDSVAVRLTVADAKGRRAEHVLEIPIRFYQQKTILMFPFRGHGIIGQDYVTSGGHGGHGDFSNEFGIDIDGLNQNDGELSDANENAADAGWGRDILAPAAGTVVYARNDIPDNPHPGVEPGPDYYNPLHDPVNAYAGNCVIIDHGNSEYSVMMHLRQGSVTVNVGDRVANGQVIGKLGSSGDSFGPHLHYQLQSGPRLWEYQSLPVKFQNMDVPTLFRGHYFVAK